MMYAVSVVLGIFFMGLGCALVPSGWYVIQYAADKYDLRNYHVSYTFQNGSGAGDYTLADITHNLKPLAEQIAKDTGVEKVLINNWIRIN